MLTEQKVEFELRRQRLMRKHRESDPELKALRRKRKRSRRFALLSSVVGFGMVMLLLKGFLLAFHGPQGYAQIVAPITQTQAADTFVMRIVAPDPISTEIAAMLRPILPQRAATQVATRPAELVSEAADDTAADP